MTLGHCVRDAAFTAERGHFQSPSKRQWVLEKEMHYLQIQETKMGLLLDENKSFCLFIGVIGTRNMMTSCYVQRKQSALLLACTFVSRPRA